jgi:UDP-glucose 4-epimerase
MSKVLVTGGSGNLGRYVVPRLVEEGHEVTIFDSAAPENLNADGTVVPFVKGDLTTLADCLRALTFSRAEVVVHLAALPHPTELGIGGRNVQRMPEDTTMRVNTMGTYYLLDAGRRVGLQQVVMASTFYVLGIGNRISNTGFQVDYLPIDEDHPLRPEDSYGFSKVFGEEMLQAYGRAYGIQSVALRLMGVVYPHRDNTGRTDVVPSPQPGFTSPIRSTHQYVDARDVANACALAIRAKGLEQFEAFYLSTDTTYREDTQDVIARVWPDLVPLASEINGTDGLITDAKARKKLGYAPAYSWRK